MQTKDDPVGLALMAESSPVERMTDNAPDGLSTSGPATAEPQSSDIDTLGKGKDKGKGGRCHTCNGEGQFARDCPSVPPVSPQAVKCMGCGGRGHYMRQCPTSNPNLK